MTAVLGTRSYSLNRTPIKSKHNQVYDSLDVSPCFNKVTVLENVKRKGWDPLYIYCRKKGEVLCVCMPCVIQGILQIGKCLGKLQIGKC